MVYSASKLSRNENQTEVRATRPGLVWLIGCYDMGILQDVRKRMSAGSANFAEAGYFENELYRSGQFLGSIVWAVSTIGLAVYVVFRTWSVMSSFLLFMFGCGVLGVLAPWMDIIRDHRRMRAVIKNNARDELAKEAVKLAAGQAAAVCNTMFFVTLILFVFVALLRGGRLLEH